MENAALSVFIFFFMRIAQTEVKELQLQLQHWSHLAAGAIFSAKRLPTASTWNKSENSAEVRFGLPFHVSHLDGFPVSLRGILSVLLGSWGWQLSDFMLNTFAPGNVEIKNSCVSIAVLLAARNKALATICP